LNDQAAVVALAVTELITPELARLMVTVPPNAAAPLRVRFREVVTG
jgi:hypothetical protein